MRLGLPRKDGLFLVLAARLDPITLAICTPSHTYLRCGVRSGNTKSQRQGGGRTGGGERMEGYKEETEREESQDKQQ